MSVLGPCCCSDVSLVVMVIVQSPSCVRLCDPMDCSTPGFPVLHLPEFAQAHVHWVGDAMQPSHPLSPPSPPSCDEQGPLCSCGVSASHCSGFSCWGAQSLGEGSVVVAHGLSCSAACGIFPDQGLNPHLLHWQVGSLPLSHQGSPIRFTPLLLVPSKEVLGPISE